MFYVLGRIDGKRLAHSERVIVTDTCAGTMALVDTDAGVQTLTHLDSRPTGLYFDWALLLTAFRPDARRILMLGLGGGEMFKVLRANGYKGELVGVDSAPDTLDVATAFGLEQLGVEVRPDDAREFLSLGGSGDLYQGIIVDLYSSSEMSPEQADAKFYRMLVSRLAPHSTALVNVFEHAQVKRVAAAMRGGGLLDVYAFPVQGQSNTMLLGVVKDDWGGVMLPSGELQESAAHRYRP